MNDGTNPKQQKASAVQSDHRAGWAVIERFGLLCSRRAGRNNDEKVRAVRTVAERALRDDAGLLRHINVAHLDELSGQKLDKPHEAHRV